MQIRKPGNKVDRRDFLRGLSVGASAAATVSGSLVEEAHCAPTEEKRKAHYQANSADTQAYYRVNRYPKK
jgi:hypothetical protein